MSEQLASPVAELPVEVTTTIHAFRRTVARRPDQIAIRDPAVDLEMTYAELQQRVHAVAGGLAKLGVGHGDTVALLVANRPEFNIADLAVATLRGVPFSVYPTLTPDQMAYVIGDAGAEVAIVTPDLLDVLLQAKEQVRGLRVVIVVDGEDAPDELMSFAELERSGAGFDGSDDAAALTADDLCTLIYTSGTTGPPKGVELTHGNVMSGVRGVHATIALPDEGMRVISWLPPAHIAERQAHHYVPMAFGGTVTCCRDSRQIVAFLPQVRPTWFFSVPRIWEKMKAALEAGFLRESEQDAKRAQAAIRDARLKLELERQGADVPTDLAERVAEADAELFAPLRLRLGLDQALALHAGGAPTPADVLEFFNAIGVRLGELWGMSETAGAGAICPPGEVRIGTIGPPSVGLELRLADDGEVLLRGEAIMRGYRNRPDMTREAIDEDGWLHTGDIGQLDSDGALRIVDRKKDIMISAGGKNMPPANIESTIKAEDPLVGQVMAVGDRRPYVTALVVLDPEYAMQWATNQALTAESLSALAAHPAVHERIDQAIQRANARLARYEQIKRFVILPDEWLPGGPQLTPTMKLKRRPIVELYEQEIRTLYDA